MRNPTRVSFRPPRALYELTLDQNLAGAVGSREITVVTYVYPVL
jgi:hypothetical protein